MVGNPEIVQTHTSRKVTGLVTGSRLVGSVEFAIRHFSEPALFANSNRNTTSSFVASLRADGKPSTQAVIAANIEQLEQGHSEVLTQYLTTSTTVLSWIQRLPISYEHTAEYSSENGVYNRGFCSTTRRRGQGHSCSRDCDGMRQDLCGRTRHRQHGGFLRRDVSGQGSRLIAMDALKYTIREQHKTMNKLLTKRHKILCPFCVLRD
jgi:hypothetical protein